jgi:hypothetical protein
VSKILALRELRRLIKEGHHLIELPKASRINHASQQHYALWNLRCRNVLHHIDPKVKWKVFANGDGDGKDFRPHAQEQIAFLESLSHGLAGKKGRQNGSNGHK